MNEYKKLEGHPDLVKNVNTGMIVNINKDKLQAAREKKAQALAQFEEMEQLKSDVHDIKVMLAKLIKER